MSKPIRLGIIVAALFAIPAGHAMEANATAEIPEDWGPGQSTTATVSVVLLCDDALDEHPDITEPARFASYWLGDAFIEWHPDSDLFVDLSSCGPGGTASGTQEGTLKLLHPQDGGFDFELQWIITSAAGEPYSNEDVATIHTALPVRGSIDVSHTAIRSIADGRISWTEITVQNRANTPVLVEYDGVGDECTLIGPEIHRVNPAWQTQSTVTQRFAFDYDIDAGASCAIEVIVYPIVDAPELESSTVLTFSLPAVKRDAHETPAIAWSTVVVLAIVLAQARRRKE